MIMVLSFVGAGLITGSYLAVQLRRLDPRRPAYSLFNLIGAAVLTYAAAVESQFGFFLLEGIWAVVSMLGFVRSSVAQRNPMGSSTDE